MVEKNEFLLFPLFAMVVVENRLKSAVGDEKWPLFTDDVDMWLDRTRRMRRDVAMMSAFDTYWDAAAMIDNSFFELLFCACSSALLARGIAILRGRFYLCIIQIRCIMPIFLHTNKGSNTQETRRDRWRHQNLLIRHTRQPAVCTFVFRVSQHH